MEYCPGGDLMSVLFRVDSLSEEEVRFYMAEAVLAIESVHALGYAHRFAASFLILQLRNCLFYLGTLSRIIF